VALAQPVMLDPAGTLAIAAGTTRPTRIGRLRNALPMDPNAVCTEARRL
jgi:hypothetical protein